MDAFAKNQERLKAAEGLGKLLAMSKFVDAACRKILAEVGDKRDVAGVIECPRCQGQLHYCVQKNGHIHGHCESEDCLKWMS
jgi:hypothetical protein